MRDQILNSFLERQYEDAMQLADDSDVLSLSPRTGDDGPPRQYVAEFACRGLVRRGVGPVEEADRFLVGVTFPSDYLRRAHPGEVLLWMGPFEIWHPNIRPPFICVGRLLPGTGLNDILYQCFEIITYQKVTMREDDAMNRHACSWARSHCDRFPLDARPLKRRSSRVRVEAVR